MQDFKTAKEMFLYYGGDAFFMERDGVLDRYKKFKITKESEQHWLSEMFTNDIGELKTNFNSDRSLVLFLELINIVYKTKSSFFFDCLQDLIFSLPMDVNPFNYLVFLESYLKLLPRFNIFANRHHDKECMINLLLKIVEGQISDETLTRSCNDKLISPDSIRTRARNAIIKINALAD